MYITNFIYVSASELCLPQMLINKTSTLNYRHEKLRERIKHNER